MKVFDMKIYNFWTEFAIDGVLVMLCAHWEYISNKRVLLSKGLLLVIETEISQQSNESESWENLMKWNESEKNFNFTESEMKAK